MFAHIDPLVVHELPTYTIKGQRWYKTPVGDLYPSITTVLSYGTKQWLIDWKNMLGEKKAEKEAKRCADRGTAVHKMLELYLDNDQEPTKKQDLENVKLFNQIKLTTKRINNIRGQEIALYSDMLGVAGRCDCIAEFDGVLSIIDFKTSNNNKDSSMIEDYFLQGTAYATMCNELYKTNIQNIVILIAVERGLMPLIHKKPVDLFVEPLKERINTFYNSI